MVRSIHIQKAATRMGNPLKEKIGPALVVVVLGNFVVFYLAVKTGALFSEGIAALVQEWQDTLPVGAAVLQTTIANGLLSRDNKARVVFWRWDNPLPSREAFSRHARAEQRINVQALDNQFGPLPSDPASESTLWYNIYRTHRDDPAITQVHRDYLLMRDWCGLSFLFLLGLGTTGLYVIDPRATAWIYVAFLLAQYLVTMIAARNYGVSFVRNVLALASGTTMKEQ